MKAIAAEAGEFVLKGHEKLDLLEGRLSAIRSGKDHFRHWSDLCPAFYEFAERGTLLGFQSLPVQARTVEQVLKRLDMLQAQPQPHVIGHLFNLADDLRRHLDHIAGTGGELNPRGPISKDSNSPSRVAHNLIPFNPLPVLQKTLIFRTPDDGRMAMPFDNVMRLESFKEPAALKAAEPAGTCHPDPWMPIIDISQVLPERRVIFRRPPVRIPMGQTRQMIVYMTPSGEVGLVVDAIMDVCKAKIEVQRPASRVGVHGSMDLADRITEILDIPAIFAQSGLVFSKSGIEAGEQIAS